ncbi:hypothetical protein GCM10027610_103260 [Dactylosporangium cerinum]
MTGNPPRATAERDTLTDAEGAVNELATRISASSFARPVSIFGTESFWSARHPEGVTFRKQGADMARWMPFCRPPTPA